MFAQAISAATTTGKEIIRFLFLSTQKVEPSLPFWKDQVFSWFTTDSISPALFSPFLWGGGGGKVGGTNVGSLPEPRLIVKPGFCTIYAS